MIRTKTLLASILFTILVVISTGMPATSFGQDSHSSLRKFVTSDVVAIGYMDLDAINVDDTFEFLKKLGINEGASFERMRDNLSDINAEIQNLKEVGISKGYVLIRTTDFETMGTSFVLPLEAGSDPGKAQEVFESVFRKAAGGQDFSYQTGFRDGAVFCGSKGNYQTLKNEIADDKTDRSEIWNTVNGQSFGLLLFGNHDSRAVASELMPQFPNPFSGITGELVGRNTNWATVSLKLNATPDFNLEIDTKDETSATIYREAIENALKMAKFLPQVREVIPKSEIKFVFDSISPEQKGNRVSMSSKKLTKDLDRLITVLAKPVQDVRRAARRTQMKNSLRQHLLAMHNYESAHDHFPTQFSADDSGKPLLSWRVHVLPFLQQHELYKQFHLDEPWDSEHNIKLVDKMPDIFSDVRAGGVANSKAGKTVFQVPAGKGLMFDGTKESSFRDITDGSSNTLGMIVMPQEKAVVWTQPTDWNVDLNDPTAELNVEGFEALWVAMLDGSIMEIPLPYPGEELKMLISPKDGGVTNWKLLEGKN